MKFLLVAASMSALLAASGCMPAPYLNDGTYHRHWNSNPPAPPPGSPPSAYPTIPGEAPLYPYR